MYMAGTPFQVSGIPQDFRGANNYRPNIVGDRPDGGRAATQRYLDAASVVIPTDPSQPFGNAPRNNIRGPLLVSGGLRGGEAVSDARGLPDQAEFRIEAFNLLNRTNFRAPNGVRSAGAFGTITSTYDPRQLQVGIKLTF